MSTHKLALAGVSGARRRGLSVRLCHSTPDVAHRALLPGTSVFKLKGGDRLRPFTPRGDFILVPRTLRGRLAFSLWPRRLGGAWLFISAAPYASVGGACSWVALGLGPVNLVKSSIYSLLATAVSTVSVAAAVICVPAAGVPCHWPAVSAATAAF